MKKRYIVLIICILIISAIVIGFSCYPLRYKFYVRDSVIIRDNIPCEELLYNIDKAYFLNTRLEDSFQFLKIHHNLSHWNIAVRTTQNKYFIVNSCVYHYIDIIRVDFIKDDKLYYRRRNRKRDAKIIKEYDVKEDISVLKYACLLNDYYTKIGNYTLTKNNCHAITIYGLTQLLKINYKNEFKRDYSFNNIMKELREPFRLTNYMKY